MPALFLNLLKLIFIALVYLFLWQVVRAIGTHLALGTPRRSPRQATEVVVVRSEQLAGKRFDISGPFVVGRSPDADLVIDDPYASDLHLRFGVHEGQMVLHDLGSTNGTYVNGRRVVAPMDLSKGDTVQIGRTILEVR